MSFFNALPVKTILSFRNFHSEVAEKEVGVDVTPTYSLVQVIQMVKTGPFRINALCYRMSAPFPCGCEKCVTASHCSISPPCHHSNRIFDPVCGILDLDVDQERIYSIYWLKCKAVLREQSVGS